MAMAAVPGSSELRSKWKCFRKIGFGLLPKQVARESGGKTRSRPDSSTAVLVVGSE